MKCKAFNMDASGYDVINATVHTRVQLEFLRPGRRGASLSLDKPHFV